MQKPSSPQVANQGSIRSPSSKLFTYLPSQEQFQESITPKLLNYLLSDSVLKDKAEKSADRIPFNSLLIFLAKLNLISNKTEALEFLEAVSKERQSHSKKKFSLRFRDLEEFLSEELYELSERLPISALALKIAFGVFKEVGQNKRTLTVATLVHFLNENTDFPLYITEALNIFGLDYTILDNRLKLNSGISLKAFIRKQIHFIKEALYQTKLFVPVEVPYFQEKSEKGVGSTTASVGGTEEDLRSSKRQSVTSSPLKELMRKNGITQDRNGKISYDSQYSFTQGSFMSTSDVTNEGLNLPPFLSTFLVNELNPQFYEPLLRPQGFLVRKSQKINQKWSDCFWRFDKAKKHLISMRPERYIILRKLKQFSCYFFQNVKKEEKDVLFLKHDPNLSDVEINQGVKLGGTEQLIDMNQLRESQPEHPRPKSALKYKPSNSLKSKVIYKEAYLMILVESDHPLKEELYARLKQKKSRYPHIFIPVRWKRVKTETVISTFSKLNPQQKSMMVNKQSFEDAILMLDKKGMIKLFAVKVKDMIPLKNTEIFSTGATFSSQRKYQFTIQKLKGTHQRNRSPKKWLGRYESEGGFFSLAKRSGATEITDFKPNKSRNKANLEEDRPPLRSKTKQSSGDIFKPESHIAKNGGLPSKGEAILAVNNEYLLKQWILSLNLIRDLEELNSLESRGRKGDRHSKSMIAQGQGKMEVLGERSTTSYFCTPQVNSWQFLGEKDDDSGATFELSFNEPNPHSRNTLESSTSGMSRMGPSFMNQTVSTISPLQYKVNLLNQEDEEEKSKCVNPFKPRIDMAPQNLNALFVEAAQDSSSNITFAMGNHTSGDFDEERQHLCGDNERLKKAYEIYHDYSLFMFENPRRQRVEFWKRATAYFYMKWQIQINMWEKQEGGRAKPASQGGLDSEENQNPLEEEKDVFGYPSTVKNEGQIRSAPVEVSKFEAFQDEEEVREITEIGGGIDLASRVLETLHSDINLPMKQQDATQDFLGTLQAGQLDGGNEESVGQTSTSNLSPVDLNEKFNKAEGIVSVFTPSPDNYETVNPPQQEEHDMQGPFSNILSNKSEESEKEDPRMIVSPNYRYKQHEGGDANDEDTPSFLRTQLQINEAKYQDDLDSFEGANGYESEDANIDDSYESEEGIINHPAQLRCQYR